MIISVHDEVDRDTWTTGPEWTKRLGPVWLDPCSNERSTVQAQIAWRLDRGQDALKLCRYLPPRHKQPGPIYINCPYSRGMVARFVEAFCRSRFIFLVRGDTSTEWWSALWPYVQLEARPDTRKLFEPPPGVENVLNVYPHSFLFSNADDCTPAMRAACYVSAPVHPPTTLF